MADQNEKKVISGRDKKKPKRHRTAYIRARIKPTEKELFKKRCEDAGLSETDYIRKKLFDEEPLRQIPRVKGKSELDLAQALHFSSKSSNNINQIAHALNKALLRSDYTTSNFIGILQTYQKMIDEAKSDISEIRTLLREKLLTNDFAR